MKKKIGWIILVIFLAIVGIRIYSILHQRAEFLKHETTEKKIAVQVVSPTVGPIARSLEFLGSIKGENQVQIYPEVPGRLLRYTVEEGQTVKNNTTIALIDRSGPGMEYEPARVRAPIHGVIVRLLLDQGMTVTPQVPVAMIADSRNKIVTVNIGEKFLSNIKKGINATIVSDLYPEKEISGKVLRISPFIDPTTRSAYCEIFIGEAKEITLGSFANVSIHLQEKNDALLIPRRAIIEDIATGNDYVFIARDNKAYKIPIKLGIVNEDKAEILNELSVESQVVTLGKEYLKDGDLIEIIE